MLAREFFLLSVEGAWAWPIAFLWHCFLSPLPRGPSPGPNRQRRW